MEPAASRQAFVLENAALLENPTHSSIVGCSPPWGAASLPTTKKAYKHRHTGRTDKQGAREEGEDRKSQEKGSPEKYHSTDGVWTSSSGLHYVSLFSLLVSISRAVFPAEVICHAKISKFFIQTHQVALLKIHLCSSEITR